MLIDIEEIKALDPSKIYVIKILHKNLVESYCDLLSTIIKQHNIRLIVINEDLEFLSPEDFELVRKDKNGT